MSPKRLCVGVCVYDENCIVFRANKLAGRRCPRRVLVRALPQTSGSILQDTCAIVVVYSMCLKNRGRFVRQNNNLVPSARIETPQEYVDSNNNINVQTDVRKEPLCIYMHNACFIHRMCVNF